MFTLDTSEEAEMPSSTTNQNLYMLSIVSGVISAALLSIPAELPNAIGSFVALVSIGFFLAIPYRLLGMIEKAEEST